MEKTYKNYFFKYIINGICRMECGSHKEFIVNLRNEICDKHNLRYDEMPVWGQDELPVFNNIKNPIKIA